MRERRKKYGDGGSIDVLLMRDRLGVGRYRKTRGRSVEKRELLLDLWLRTIKERERKDYLRLGQRKRRLTLP